jgi:membrane protein DedA with SNARE-associated domain
MLDFTTLVDHLGYGAIFVGVALGNLGIPVPEETILAMGGYLAQRGELRLPVVIVVGFLSAVFGDNLGYWVGAGTGGPRSSATGTSPSSPRRASPG